MNNQNNITGETNKPRLKKVKKPIRRIQPQVPNDAYSMKEKKDPANMGRNDVNTNPFQQQAVSSKTKTGSIALMELLKTLSYQPLAKINKLIMFLSLLVMKQNIVELIIPIGCLMKAKKLSLLLQ